MKKALFALAFFCFSKTGIGQNFSLLKDLLTVGIEPNGITDLAKLDDGSVYFLQNKQTGDALFRIDPAGGERQLVKTLFASCDYRGPNGFWQGDNFGPKIFSDGKTIFLAYPRLVDGQFDWDFWASDGTEIGTKKAGASESVERFLKPIEGRLPSGRALVTDGQHLKSVSPTGTLPLNLLPASATLQPGMETVFQGHFLFNAFDPQLFGFTQIWATDGTVAGTKPLLMPAGTSDFYGTRAFGEVGGKLVLLAEHADQRLRLWAIDSAVSSISLLREFAQPWGVAPFGRMVEYGGRLVFHATGAANFSFEIWATDGTVAGTEFLIAADPSGGCWGCRSAPFFVHKGQLFYHGSDAGGNKGIFYGDGLAAPEAVGPLFVDRFFEQDSVLFGWRESDLTIYRLFDGQPALAPAWSAGLSGGVAVPGGLFFRNGKANLVLFKNAAVFEKEWLVFEAFGPPVSMAILEKGAYADILQHQFLETEKAIFWHSNKPGRSRVIRSDGLETALLYEPITEKNLGSEPFLYPTADESTAFLRSSGGFFRTDGTEPGTTDIRFLFDQPIYETATVGSEFWFRGDNGIFRTEADTFKKIADGNWQLLRTTPERMWAVRDSSWQRNLVSIDLATLEQTVFSAATVDAPVEFETLGEQIFFRSSTASTGAEVWKIDAATGETTFLKDIEPGPDAGLNRFVGKNSALVFFTGRTGGYPNPLKLWRTDGFAAGTEAFFDWSSLGHVGWGEPFGQVGDTALFIVHIGDSPGAQAKKELWATDGAACWLVEKMHGFAGSMPVKKVGETHFFWQFENVLNAWKLELWKTGATNGSAEKVEIGPCPDHLFRSVPSVAVADGRLWFLAETVCTPPGGPLSIWSTDGSAGGTKVLMTDTCSGLREPEELAEFGEKKLLLRASDRMHGAEPWIFDAASVWANEPENDPFSAEKQAFRPFPNPFSDLLFLQKEAAEPPRIFEKAWLTDALGRTVFEKKQASSLEPLRLGELPAGAYFLFWNEKGRAAEAVGAVLKR